MILNKHFTPVWEMVENFRLYLAKEKKKKISDLEINYQIGRGLRVIDCNNYTNDEYVKKYRVQLSLWYDTYKEHIEWLWYKVWYLDAWDRMLYWVIVPISNIPKEFLINTEFYQANRAYINWIKE